MSAGEYLDIENFVGGREVYEEHEKTVGYPGLAETRICSCGKRKCFCLS